MTDSKWRWLSFAVLCIGISSSRLIPFGPFPGLDFQNLYAFHTCDYGQYESLVPYSVPGQTCQDALGRDMIYPPLLYWSYFWVRPFEFEPALYLQWIVLVASLGFSVWVWTRRSIDFFGWVAVGLCILQYPTLFSLERANTDLVVVALWSWAYLKAKKREWFFAGVLMAMACHFKVYPVIAVSLILLGWLSSRITYCPRPIQAIKYGKVFSGLSLGIMALSLWFFRDIREYFYIVMPKLSVSRAYVVGFTHSPVVYIPWFNGVIAYGLAAIVYVLWCLRARTDRNDSYVFAGSLALSTYFSGVSFDYNLVTVLPLMILLACQSQWRLFAFGSLAFFLHRGIVISLSPALGIILTLVQLGFLAACALSNLNSNRRLLS